MAPGLITASTRILQIKIELGEVRPHVWRRVLVPDAMTLNGLHDVIQQAMGWTDSHLHEFEIDAQRFAPPDEDNDEEVLDSTTATLGLVAGQNSDLSYLYDFGDGWSHTLIVEAVLAPEPGGRYPRCLAGARPCPPEDVGGPHGYGEFLAALRDPDHPGHEELTAWAEGFDPGSFDLAIADKRLEELAWINSA
ncbi:plasmid pRiA4b ORF-3 family protein [Sporichthya sp.]|uniref:plasmid pRiA4b ORF-3 family protein n=1 Tax=Sporichthya sp. TaxID=65475 RepID=UPI0017F1076E|nr:plasmid pRiA4b ORF-3 family protein [Sporichthya sp.]MBA3742861.1 plasmid pRiA4b ORF-3 family protein [Sporichthya sp.]